MSRRAIAYVDGFNFYHGVVRTHPELKWLNFEALCDALLRGCSVAKVNYYTAVVKDSPDDPGQSQRQDNYLRALRVQPRTEVILGQFQRKKVSVSPSEGTSVELLGGGSGMLAGNQRIKGRVWEEKGSDVNLGTDLSWDASQGAMQVALVLSNDLDLQRPITRAMAVGIEVVVVNPHQRTNSLPSLVGTATRKLSRRELLKAQMPDLVSIGGGVVVQRPASWR